jgi:leucyl-tRNA synthetase
MDTFVDSSWYFYRYTDPHNDRAPFRQRLESRLLVPDRPVHWRRRARDPPPHLFSLLLQGDERHSASSNHREPVKRLFSQGMVLKDGAKMSKSKGNLVGAIEMADKYGCDTGRMYTLSPLRRRRTSNGASRELKAPRAS